MYQCILNIPLWNDWSKVTYSQVRGSPVLKALFSQSFKWISARRFAELIQFWQDPKWRRNKTFWRKNFVFHWRKISYFVFSYIYIYICNIIYKFICIIYIYMCITGTYNIYIYIYNVYTYIYVYMLVIIGKVSN